MSAKNQHIISRTLEIRAVLSEGTPSAEEENEERAYFKVQNDDVIKDCMCCIQLITSVKR